MEIAARTALWPRKDGSRRTGQKPCGWQVCESRAADVGAGLAAGNSKVGVTKVPCLGADVQVSRSAEAHPGARRHTTRTGAVEESPGHSRPADPNPSRGEVPAERERLAKPPVHLINFKCSGNQRKFAEDKSQTSNWMTAPPISPLCLVLMRMYPQPARLLLGEGHSAPPRCHQPTPGGGLPCRASGMKPPLATSEFMDLSCVPGRGMGLDGLGWRALHDTGRRAVPWQLVLSRREGCSGAQGEPWMRAGYCSGHEGKSGGPWSWSWRRRREAMDKEVNTRA